MHILRLVDALGIWCFVYVAGHTLFTNLFVNDIDQGDGTCVRMPMIPHNATHPIINLGDRAMACGHGGFKGVARVCPVPAKSTLSFQFRKFPDGAQQGSIDSSHLGPCAVYMKKVESAIKSSGAGEGWFKIASSGYDESTKKWCTETLIANNGLLSVHIPNDLAGGYYLVRPELLSLHDADKHPPNPQFYTGCAQIFLNSTATTLPKYTVQIPGYVGISNASVLFDIYNPILPYPEPGPEKYTPDSSPGTRVEAVKRQMEGLIPGNAVLTNANWWALEVERYGDEAGCWNASKSCYAQLDTCYKTAPPTGSKNCKVWEGRCSNIQTACGKMIFTGPPVFSLPLDPLPQLPALKKRHNAVPVVGSTSNLTTLTGDGVSRTRDGQKSAFSMRVSETDAEQMIPASITVLPKTSFTADGQPPNTTGVGNTLSGDLVSDTDTTSIQPWTPISRAQSSTQTMLYHQLATTALNAVGIEKPSSVASTADASTISTASTTSTSPWFTYKDTIHIRPATTSSEDPLLTFTMSSPGSDPLFLSTTYISSSSEISPPSPTTGSTSTSTPTSPMTPTRSVKLNPSIILKPGSTLVPTSTVFVVSGFIETVTLGTRRSSSISAVAQAQSSTSSTATATSTGNPTRKADCEPNRPCPSVDPEMDLPATMSSPIEPPPSLSRPEPTNPNSEYFNEPDMSGFFDASEDVGESQSGIASPSTSLSSSTASPSSSSSSSTASPSTSLSSASSISSSSSSSSNSPTSSSSSRAMITIVPVMADTHSIPSIDITASRIKTSPASLASQPSPDDKTAVKATDTASTSGNLKERSIRRTWRA